ncbi:MAG: hypothetical protein JXB47_03690 [Anaerolineae bacterium]|nr:hypothetical protein [Anaerolineae bacterium]
MNENIAKIADGLRRIQTEGGGGNFAIVEAYLADGRMYYIQFAGAIRSPDLYAEAVSNVYLDASLRLGNAQIARLQKLGWQPPQGEANFSRTWQAHTDQDREAIAREVMRAFTEVYGVPPGAAVDVHVNLE